ncbi:MAG: NUDIX hydrolase, partial [Parcubacteria group bacterium]|nr:NUDIX hydrolase [Parcubacteria group bacterium]
MAVEKWEKIKTKRVYSGWQKIDLVTFKLPDGKLKDFDIIDHGGKDVISVVGVTKNKEFVVVQQYRPGPGKIFYEFCLGIVEEGEDIVEAAEREFLEETGHKGKLEKIGIRHHGAYDGARMHCFIALDCEKVTDELKLDDSEFIEVELFPLDKFKKLLRTGEIRNFGEGYWALDYLNL